MFHGRSAPKENQEQLQSLVKESNARIKTMQLEIDATKARIKAKREAISHSQARIYAQMNHTATSQRRTLVHQREYLQSKARLQRSEDIIKQHKLNIRDKEASLQQLRGQIAADKTRRVTALSEKQQPHTAKLLTCLSNLKAETTAYQAGAKQNLNFATRIKAAVDSKHQKIKQQLETKIQTLTTALTKYEDELTALEHTRKNAIKLVAALKSSTAKVTQPNTTILDYAQLFRLQGAIYSITDYLDFTYPVFTSTIKSLVSTHQFLGDTYAEEMKLPDPGTLATHRMRGDTADTERKAVRDQMPIGKQQHICNMIEIFKTSTAPRSTTALFANPCTILSFYQSTIAGSLYLKDLRLTSEIWIADIEIMLVNTALIFTKTRARLASEIENLTYSLHQEIAAYEAETTLLTRDIGLHTNEDTLIQRVHTDIDAAHASQGTMYSVEEKARNAYVRLFSRAAFMPLMRNVAFLEHNADREKLHNAFSPYLSTDVMTCIGDFFFFSRNNSAKRLAVIVSEAQRDFEGEQIFGVTTETPTQPDNEPSLTIGAWM